MLRELEESGGHFTIPYTGKRLQRKRAGILPE